MVRHFFALAGFFAVGCLLTLAAAPSLAAIDPHATAAKVDELLTKEIFASADASQRALLSPPADDEAFLRRISLDLVGESPAPEEITKFALDTSPNKRRAAVERLLANPQFGQNWARYWRDVILYRRSDERALVGANPLVVYLTEQFNKDAHWDQLAREFITATGDVRKNGSAALILAQMAEPSDTTAEISRIFLGIQIQCAQCHNHPTDRWKREQFHELAAFFPRIGVRPSPSPAGPPSFAIVSLNRPQPRRSPANQTPTTAEYFMPDLENPQAQGTRMQPVFFVTGQKLPFGQGDLERRKKLAEWITAPTDPWFAKAYVNRMWSELVGQGFYEPVDDMGPDRKATAPKTLNYLANQFVASGYDVKWLFRAVTSTAAYARQSRSRHESGAVPFAANCPQRLRADQLFNALAEALGMDESSFRPGGGGPRAYFNNPRGRVQQTFGYDPSARRDELASTIPQALWLMNSPELNRTINGRRPDTSLGKLLAEEKDDEAVAVELYLRCLAREPKDAELKTCLDHVRSTGKRAEAFEDILWSLVNSTEFSNRK